MCGHFTLLLFYVLEGASHSLCRDGTIFSGFGVFETPETHIRHVQNLILIAERESACLNTSIGIIRCPQTHTDKHVRDSAKLHIILSLTLLTKILFTYNL